MDWIRDNLGIFTGFVALLSALASWWTTRRIQAAKTAKADALSEVRHAEAQADAAKQLQSAASAAEQGRQDAEARALEAEAKQREATLAAADPMKLTEAMVGKGDAK